jgi:hypothetical protein
MGAVAWTHDRFLRGAGVASVTDRFCAGSSFLPPLKTPELLEMTYDSVAVLPSKPAREMRLAQSLSGPIYRSSSWLGPAGFRECIGSLFPASLIGGSR